MAVLVCSVLLIILGCLRVGSELPQLAPQTMGDVRGGVRFKGMFADLYWSVLRSLSWSPRAPKWQKQAHTGLLRCQGGGLNHTTPKGAHRARHRGQGPSPPPTTRRQGQPNPRPGQGHRPAQQARGPSRCNPMAEAEAGRADSRTQQGSARV